MDFVVSSTSSLYFLVFYMKARYKVVSYWKTCSAIRRHYVAMISLILHDVMQCGIFKIKFTSATKEILCKFVTKSGYCRKRNNMRPFPLLRHMTKQRRSNMR